MMKPCVIGISVPTGNNVLPTAPANSNTTTGEDYTILYYIYLPE